MFKTKIVLISFVFVLIASQLFAKAGDITDYVDNNTSDVDSHVGHGTHSSFPAIQAGPDSTFDTLTEANTGGAPLTITFVNVGAEATGTGAVTPALPASMQSNDICVLVATTITAGTVTITATGSITIWTAITGSPVDVTLGEKLYVWWGRWTSGTTGPTVTPGGDHIEAGIGAWRNCLGSGSPIDVSQTGTETVSDTTFSFATSISTTVNGAMCIAICTTGQDIATNGRFTTMTDGSLTSLAERIDYCTSSGSGGGFALDEGYKATTGVVGTWASTLLVASTKAYISFALKPALAANYELDLEIQWTTADFDEENEYLCIYTGTVNAEALKVDVRSGSSWVNIIASLSVSQWNNVSIGTYLTGTTITFRFLGSTETSDTTQSTWQIDCVLLHTYTTVVISYKLNLRMKDWTKTDNIQNCIVTMNNGSDRLKTSDVNGWSNYTGISASSVTVKVRYFGFWVNGTFTVSMSSDKTIDVKCKLYDVYVKVKPFNNQGIVWLANVTAFNTTSIQNNKIKTNITNTNGIALLKNLPNNTLTFTIYCKSDYSVVIANYTQTITSDQYSLTLSGTQNHGSVDYLWSITLITGIVLSYGNKSVTKTKIGGNKECRKMKNQE